MSGSGGTAILQFLGATDTVTGSKFLVDTGHHRVLVDCGLYQGSRPLRARNWAPLAVDPARLDAVVLTHAHLDHVGYLPVLVRDGFTGPVLCTDSTKELAGIVLDDAARLLEEEAAYANRKGFSRHDPALPLYDQADAARALRAMIAAPYDQPLEALPGMHVVLRPAGHILGSATVELRIDDAARSVLFTGDLGRTRHPLLQPPAAPPPADVIVSESTYGDRTHGDEEAALEQLAQVVSRTAARGGTVVIPAFAVDRTEVVLMALRRLTREGRIPPLPVYADSPMALAVLDVYRRAHDRGDAELRADVGPDPFDPGGGLHEVPTPQGSRELNDLRFPSIIVSASGMATGGRVLHHLARRLPDRRNAVVLAGFQAPGTRGSLLASGIRSLKIHGEYVPVRAEVLQTDAFSVHADAPELLAWLASGPRPPDVAFMVHGEAQASGALRDRLCDDLGWNAVVPTLGERVRVG